MPAVLITAAASIVAAAIGYLSTQVVNLRLEQHRNQLARVNQQLSKLYGPLHAMTQSNGIAYYGMRDKYDPEGLFDQRTADSLARITPEQRETYKLWMVNVLQPTSRMARELLLHNTDLLLQGKMPESVLRWFAHVAGYDAILTSWANGDDSELFSLVPYPRDFTEYIAESFQTLQARQADLLERISGGRYSVFTLSEKRIDVQL
jgi:hypothetical protein